MLGRMGSDMSVVESRMRQGLDPDGNLLIVDSGNGKIRRVTFQNTSSGVLAFTPTAQDHSSLTRNADGSFLRTYRNGTRVAYDSQAHPRGGKTRGPPLKRKSLKRPGKERAILEWQSKRSSRSFSCLIFVITLSVSVKNEL